MMKRTILAVLFLFLFNSLTALETIKLTAPDNTEVIIIRDNYGVPHIFADNEEALFFAQGFAQAYDRTIQLEIHRKRALGRLSEIGPLIGNTWWIYYYIMDYETRNNYYSNEELEEIFNSMNPNVRQAIISFSDGINRYLDSARVNPNKYKHFFVNTVEAFYGIEYEPWEPLHTLAIMNMLARLFGGFGGYELDNQWYYELLGHEGFNKEYPLNVPELYTTIEDDVDGGIIQVPDFVRPNMNLDYEQILNLKQKRELFREIDKELGIPLKFGSFALICDKNKTDDGSAVHLGGPQMANNIEKQELPPINEVELRCPGYHVGGIAVTGIPFVIIGRNNDFSWTFTSGYSDNTDVMVHKRNEENLEVIEYWYNGEYIKSERELDSVKILELDGFSVSYNTEYFYKYRSVYGTLLRDEASLYSLQMTYWKKEYIMWELLYNLNKATNIKEVEPLFQLNPLSFNLFYSGKDGTIKYWHLGHYPIRADGIDPRLPTKGDGSEDWQGIVPFDELPKQSNPPNGYFINWNNKPAKNWNNGDNLPWLNESFPGEAVNRMYDFVSKNKKLNYELIKTLPKYIESHGSYQQIVRYYKGEVSNSENILPPGQNEFITINGENSPHNNDQHKLFLQYKFKPWLFGIYNPKGQSGSGIDFTTVQIYPNPADDYINILSLQEITEIRITDYLGRVFIEMNEKNITQIDIRTLAIGSYTINMLNAKGKKITKTLMVMR